MFSAKHNMNFEGLKDSWNVLKKLKHKKTSVIKKKLKAKISKRLNDKPVDQYLNSKIIEIAAKM